MPHDTLPDLDSPDTLYRLAYLSRWDVKNEDGSPSMDGFKDVLAKSRENNQAGELTGILLHSDGALIQVIEGPMATIEATFERICQDMRHTELKLIDYVPVHKRHFGDWMASELGTGYDPARPQLQTKIMRLFDQMQAEPDGIDIVSQIADLAKIDEPHDAD